MMLLTDSNCHRHSTEWGVGWWIGAKRFERSRTSPFVWKTLGSGWCSGSYRIEEMSYSNWRHGEPNYSGNREECTAVFHKYDDEWNDTSCDDPFCYIREVDMLPTED